MYSLTGGFSISAVLNTWISCIKYTYTPYKGCITGDTKWTEDWTNTNIAPVNMLKANVQHYCFNMLKAAAVGYSVKKTECYISHVLSASVMAKFDSVRFTKIDNFISQYFK